MTMTEERKLPDPAALDHRWRWWLITGISALVLLMLAAVGLGWYQTSQSQQRLNHIIDQHARKLELTQQLFQASLGRTLLLHRILLQDNPFARDESKMQLYRLGSQFTQARQALLDQPLAPAEVALLRRQGQLAAKAIPLQQGFLEQVDAGRAAEAEGLLRAEVMPLQNALLHTLEELARLSQEALRDARQAARADDRRARAWSLMLSALILAPGLWLAVQITRHTAQANRLREHLALHDTLTGLPNRQLLCDRMEQAMAHARRTHTRLGVMFVDLDHFKLVNDSLGHAAGDELIRTVAARLRAAVRAEDTVARVGGDEFVVLAGEAKEVAALVQVAEQIITALRASIPIAGREIFVGCSVGLSVYPGDAEQAPELLRCADLAMYHAKQRGRSCLSLYDPEMNGQAMQRMELETALRHAFERDEFALHYQPQLDWVSGEVKGVEALVRWQHPEKGVIPPGDFLPLAEQSDLILHIGRRLLLEACRHCQEWNRLGHDLKVAFNVSGREFWHGDLVGTLRSALESTGLPAHYLQVELTEGILMHNVELATERIRAIKALGVKVAVDDFGTGHSSLAHLKRFPIDVLKVDRYFVKDIEHQATDRAIVRAILALADSLGLEVVAEGVESEAQITLLRELGCTLFQGYHVSRPLSANQLLAWLREHRVGRTSNTRVA